MVCILWFVSDDHPRILGCTSSKSYDAQIKCLQKHSWGMNVSGSTIRMQNVVYLTRKEEIIKLMFHELIHYIGLDAELVGVDIQSKWATDSDEMLGYEAYTEFLSVVLHTAYVANFVDGNNNDEPIDTKLFYSMLSMEIEYSINLCKKVLMFYNYDETTFVDFFNTETDLKHKQPILLWEYILLRTIVLLDNKSILELVTDSNLRLDSETVTGFIAIINNDTDLVIAIKKSFKKQSDFKIENGTSISYLAFDVDWNKT